MKLQRSMLFYVTGGLVAFVATVAVILINSVSSAYAHENTLNINIAGACTFSTGGGNYSVSMVDGSTEINANSITTSCNDASGYAIYAVGYSGDSDTGNNTDLINTANSTYNIKTDGSSDTGSNWKLKFTVVSDATIAGSYNTYQNIPSTYTKVASYNNSTASGIITPHYQINLVGIQQPGTYVGQVKYVLVHPNTMSPTYTINYNTNGGSGTMTSSTPSSFESFTLPTSTLTTPTGYSFAGWCTVQDTNQIPQTTCTGDTYTDGETILAGDISAGTTLNLYATWESTTIYMQDMTDAQCQQNVGTNGNATNIGDNITVYDKRATSGNNNYSSGDDGDYTVRWINGACWMTQNLRIQGTVSATDSNFSSGSINVSQYDLKTNGSSECGSSNGYNNPCSRVPDSTDMSTIGSGVTAKEVGAWYNYYATTAGTISTNSNSTVASSDICPSGWHLPTGAANNTSSEFYKLFQSTSTGYINPNNYLTAFGAVKGGFYYTGSLSGPTYGFWWPATANNTTSRYYLRYNSSSGQFSSGYNYRYNGFFVRCVKQKDYMQDFTLASADDDVEYTLVDKRDNNTYTVKKINGQLWMTQNLRYLGDTGSAAKTMTIGNNNSNVANKSITLYSLDSSNAGSFNAYSSSYCDNTNGYTHACVYDSGNTSTGVWYNYYAASAGTIDGSSNTTAAISDICPAGWHLPSGPNTTANTDYNKLVGNTTDGWQAATSGLTAFSAVAGGGYYNGSLSSTGYVYWWSATAGATALRYGLGYNSSNGQFVGNIHINRPSGLFVRCVRSS